MEKVIKNGQVGVLISPGYGAGWSTWNHDVDPKVMMMDARIIKAWQAGRLTEGNVFEVLKELGIIDDDDYVYGGGVSSLTLQWVPIGQEFRVVENDGFEYVQEKEEIDWLTA